MEKQQFLDTLAVLPFEWYLDGNNLRAKDEGGHEHCPITAVCYFLTARRLGAHKFLKAGKIIGLPSGLTSGLKDDICRAADKGWFHDKGLRQELLDRTVNRRMFIDETLKKLEYAMAETSSEAVVLTKT